jgi:hypothetical protein
MFRQGHGAHVQRRKNEAGYFRSATTRHPKNSGDSSQASTANINNPTCTAIARGKKVRGKNVGCIRERGEIQRSENKTTPRPCEIAVLKAPQPQSTLTRYYTFVTHATIKLTNFSMRTKSVP